MTRSFVQRGERRSYFSGLERTEGYPSDPEGYLNALTSCYRAYKRGLSLPDLVFPWEGPTKTALDAASPPKLPLSSSRPSRRAKWQRAMPLGRGRIQVLWAAVEGRGNARYACL
jgi:hypothetical protein